MLLLIFQRCWGVISINFVTGLPWFEGFDTILVVVDCLTKQKYLVPYCSDINEKYLAHLLTQHISCLHRDPLNVFPDRDPQFASEFWNLVTNRLRIDRRLSTAFHTEIDEQTERLNGVIEYTLHAFVNYLQEDRVSGYQ